MGGGDGLGLARDGGGKIARLVGPVVVDGTALDDGQDGIAIGNGIRQAAECHHTGTRAENRAFGAVIEGAASGHRARESRFP